MVHIHSKVFRLLPTTNEWIMGVIKPTAPTLPPPPRSDCRRPFASARFRRVPDDQLSKHLLFIDSRHSPDHGKLSEECATGEHHIVSTPATPATAAIQLPPSPFSASNCQLTASFSPQKSTHSPRCWLSTILPLFSPPPKMPENCLLEGKKTANYIRYLSWNIFVAFHPRPLFTFNGVTLMTTIT